MKSQILDCEKYPYCDLKSLQLQQKNHILPSDSLLYSNSIFFFTGFDFIFDRKALIAMMQANYAVWVFFSNLIFHYIILY